MTFYIWDQNLADQAQTYAEKCNLNKDENIGYDIGENVHVEKTTTHNSWDVMVDDWFDVDVTTVQDYNNMTEAIESNGLAEYTQVHNSNDN